MKNQWHLIENEWFTNITRASAIPSATILLAIVLGIQESNKNLFQNTKYSACENGILLWGLEVKILINERKETFKEGSQKNHVKIVQDCPGRAFKVITNLHEHLGGPAGGLSLLHCCIFFGLVELLHCFISVFIYATKYIDIDMLDLMFWWTYLFCGQLVFLKFWNQRWRSILYLWFWPNSQLKQVSVLVPVIWVISLMKPTKKAKNKSYKKKRNKKLEKSNGSKISWRISIGF